MTVDQDALMSSRFGSGWGPMLNQPQIFVHVSCSGQEVQSDSTGPLLLPTRHPTAPCCPQPEQPMSTGQHLSSAKLSNKSITGSELNPLNRLE